MRMLEMNFLGSAVRQPIHHHLDNLHIGSRDPGDTSSVDLNLSRESGLHVLKHSGNRFAT